MSYEKCLEEAWRLCEGDEECLESVDAWCEEMYWDEEELNDGGGVF